MNSHGEQCGEVIFFNVDGPDRELHESIIPRMREADPDLDDRAMLTVDLGRSNEYPLVTMTVLWG